jgi:hypothetical protein
LIDITLDRPAAEAQLRSFSFERLILWYHDLYAKRYLPNKSGKTRTLSTTRLIGGVRLAG